MTGKIDKKFRNLIDMLDGAKNKGEAPPVRVLIYRVDKDAFEDIRYSSQKPDPSKKTLLLIHGTMAVTTNFVLDQQGNLPKKVNLKLGSFAELLYRAKEGTPSFLKSWMSGPTKYEQVIAFDHLTLREDIKQNVVTLMELLPEKNAQGQDFCFEKDVDIIAGSRGALVGKQLASSFSRSKHSSSSKLNTKVPVGNLAFIAAGNGSHLLTLDELAPKHLGDKKARYREGLKTFIDQLGILSVLKFFIKRYINKNDEYIYQFMLLPGIQNMIPESIWLREILDASPATPQEKETQDANVTLFFPVTGKYDTSDYKTMKSDIKEIRRNIERKIRNFFLRLFFIHKIIGSQITRIFKKEVDVLKKSVFDGLDTDLVIASQNQASAPNKHYAPMFRVESRASVNGSVNPAKSVAIHSYYLNQEYLNSGQSIKETIKDFLERPNIPNPTSTLVEGEERA